MDFYHLVISFFLLSSSLCNDAAEGVVHNNRCKPTEREALLLFKRNNVPDTKGVFSSWVGTDCCRNWTGVACDYQTGHVVELNVGAETYQGVVPPQIGNLTHLQSLELTGFRIEGEWIVRLSSLEDLRLQETDLQGAPGFIYNLNMLPFISGVYFHHCNVSIPESLEHVNFTHLSRITLEDNSVNMRLSNWLFNVTGLWGLSMFASHVSGPIPPAVGNLYNLGVLILSDNELRGSIPETLGGLQHLYFLSLENNELTGSIPSSIGNLSSIWMLSLSANRLNGSIPVFTSNLTRLRLLYLRNINVRFSSDWNPPFQLEALDLSSCKVGPSFPRWIQTQSQLDSLNLSNSGISGMLPTWLWDLSRIEDMDLSGNNLSGSIPSIALNMPQLRYFHLANNHIEGPLPQFKNASKLAVLLLYNNSFSGGDPHFLLRAQYSGFGSINEPLIGEGTSVLTEIE